MGTFYTLIVGGIEKSLQDWGVTLGFQVRWRSLAPSEAILRTTEQFDPIATNWQFKQHAIVYRDRTAAEDGGSYANGTVLFQGYFDEPEMEAHGERQNLIYTLRSVWWLFERNQFKQYTNQFVGFSKTNTRIIAAQVVASGNNYKVGDTGTILGGAGLQATYQVVGINAPPVVPPAPPPSGSVTLVVLTNGGGNYTNNPVSPAQTQSTTGIGGGLKLSLTMGQAPNLVAQVISEIYLGEDLHQAEGFTELWPNGNGDQIGEVIDWMNLSYNPTRHPSFGGAVDPTQDVVQKGILDPHTQMPITRVNTYFAAEAIKDCLRWDPDTVCQEDPTTFPPTLNFRKLARWDNTTIPPTFKDYLNLPVYVIPITKQQEVELLLQGQRSKILPGVIIIYKSLNQVDGASVPSWFYDIFPNDGSIDNWTPETSTHLIELEGSKIAYLQALVTVNTIAPLALLASGVAANQVAWWQAQDKSLSDPSIDQTTLAIAGPVTVVLEGTNTPVDIVNTFINQLTSALPTWTGQTSVRVRVSQSIKFSKMLVAGSKGHDTDQAGRLHSKTIVVTTAQGQLYSALGSFVQAEAIPQNVAQSVYRSLALKQYSGNVSLDDSPMRSGINLGQRLVLIGPNHTFGDPANAANPSIILIQEIIQSPAYGKTQLIYGPTPAVNLETWIELARASRGRLTYNLPSGRGDGGSNPSGSAVDTGSASPADDTSHSIGGNSFQSVTAPAP